MSILRTALHTLVAGLLLIGVMDAREPKNPPRDLSKVR